MLLESLVADVAMVTLKNVGVVAQRCLQYRSNITKADTL